MSNTDRPEDLWTSMNRVSSLEKQRLRDDRLKKQNEDLTPSERPPTSLANEARHRSPFLRAVSSHQTSKHRGKSKRIPGFKGPFPIDDNSEFERDVVAFVPKEPASPRRRQFIPKFGLRSKSRNNDLASNGPSQHPRSPLGNREPTTHNSHPVIEKPRLPIVEEEHDSADSPQSTTQNYAPPHEFPDNFSDEIYQHSFDYLSRKLSVSSTNEQRLRNVLRQDFDRIKTLKPFPALAKSHRCRTVLLRAASNMGISDTSEFRDALQKDEENICGALCRTLNSQRYREMILCSQGQDVQYLLGCIQMIVDGKYPFDEKYRRQAHHFLLAFCTATLGNTASPIMTEQVELLNMIAISGNDFSDIYQASYRGQTVSLQRLRIFSKGTERLDIYKIICREAARWRRFENPSLLPFVGLDAETFLPFLSMVSPWMGKGTILQHVARTKEVKVRQWMLQVVQGLQYLHSHSYVHGDLKGANILIDDSAHVRIAGFGLIPIILESDESNGCSSTRWMAPELLSPEDHGSDGMAMSMASDVYALGCTLLEIYTGLRPFDDIANDMAVSLQVLKGSRPRRKPCNPIRPVSDRLWSIIHPCWDHDPSVRPEIEKVVEMIQPWCRGTRT